MQAKLGLQRNVVVQPSAYGFDNQCTLSAVAALGSARGIVVVPPEISDDDLRSLSARGVRGIRYLMLAGCVLRWDSLEAMAARIAPLGWHVQIQLDGRTLPDYEDLIRRLACPVVIEHNGKFLEPVSVNHPGVHTLRRLLDSGACWVKISAPYETSRAGPPRYEDVGRIAKALIRTAPKRCVWATNWPHPNQSSVPDEMELWDLLLDWADDENTGRRILVDNPVQLYGF